MFVLERIISVIAPHICIGCGQEGRLLCQWCLADAAPPLPERCYSCHALSPASRVCGRCRRLSPLKHVWVRTAYDGLPKQLTQALKFGRANQAALPIAQLLVEVLPYLPESTIIVPVPTATSRIRQRGYDQAHMLARAVSAHAGLPYQRLLARKGQSRQVGSGRSERRTQLTDAFRPIHEASIHGASVVLIDDVVTTGASLECAAKVLKQAGAKHIDALVFAQKQ